jgi:hypothetical protein
MAKQVKDGKIVALVTNETKLRFDAICGAENRSMSGQATALIENYILLYSNQKYLKEYNNLIADCRAEEETSS